jgi:membrane complex biogenesis BtpA family protein
MVAIVGELVAETALPVGVNVLRNDGQAALSIAAATGAAFVRINVLGRPVVSEQGIISGEAAEVLRLRAQLGSPVGIWADAAVKHATPLTAVTLDAEVYELTERCGADAVIVSGDRTGSPTDPMIVKEARRATDRPVLIGSGVTAASVGALSDADGFIVGTAFEASPGAPVESERVARVMEAVRTLRASTEPGPR